jgi:hypothetical protein
MKVNADLHFQFLNLKKLKFFVNFTVKNLSISTVS